MNPVNQPLREVFDIAQAKPTQAAPIGANNDDLFAPRAANAPAIGSDVLTMSSTEISILIKVRKDNVKVTIERLAARGLITFTATQQKATGGRPGEVYHVNKRDSHVVVAQLSPEFTARLVDRWQELEDAAAKPALPNFADPVAAARAWADAKEAEQRAAILAQERAILIEQMRPASDFMAQYFGCTGNHGFRATAKLLNANESDFRDFLFARKIMYRLEGKLIAYAAHLDAGRFHVDTRTVQNDTKIVNECKFTPKGVNWVAGKWGKHKVAPHLSEGDQ